MSKWVSGILITLHRLGGNVVIPIILEVSNLNAASALGVDSCTKGGDSNWDLLVAGECSRDNEVAKLTLGVDNGAAVILAARTTA